MFRESKNYILHACTGIYTDIQILVLLNTQRRMLKIFFAGLIFKMRINLKIRMTILSGNLNMIKNN